MPDEGRSKRLSLRNLLRPTVDAQPTRAALHGHQVWTYRRLEEEANRLARTWLARGLEPGERVAMLLPNRPEALLVYLACFKSGLAAVALDYRYQAPQINYVLRHSGSRILVSHADRLDEVAACDEAQHVDIAVVGGDGSRHGARPLTGVQKERKRGRGSFFCATPLNRWSIKECRHVGKRCRFSFPPLMEEN